MQDLPNTVWRPDVTVATVVEHAGRFLLVEERIRGALVVNQPAGHLDPGETLVEAAIRETLEETAWDVEPTGLVGVYQWVNPVDGLQVVRFTFAARAVGERRGRALDHGIERALWLTSEELGGFVPRSPMVRRSIEDFRRGTIAPLATLAAIEFGRAS
jgi:8-oxo-dGTP pyrophosphatase MutT (NUDIX family)